MRPSAQPQSMLPETLLALLNVALAAAQARQQLQINSSIPLGGTNPPVFTIPTSQKLTVSIALCSSTNSAARFFVSNASSSGDPPTSSGGSDVYEIPIRGGFGLFSGGFGQGGMLAVEGLGQTTAEVGLSDIGPVHTMLLGSPLLGDTTSTEAILFSWPFDSPSIEQPSYPNYTLPQANLTLPSPPSSAPNLTLIISPTSSASNLTRTGCGLLSAASSGSVVNQTFWQRDSQGWRSQWLVNRLSPRTNYTAFVVQDGTKVGGPVYFSTKSSGFSCPFVHSLPYCPGIAYAVPLPAPPGQDITYNSSTIPNSIVQPLLSSLTNFTTTLTTFACGRDIYSPLVGCADCQAAYRKWLCAVSFPRCGEARDGDSLSEDRYRLLKPSEPDPIVEFEDGAPQQVISALIPVPTTQAPRNPTFPRFNESYTTLLPCIETCYEADRRCPSFLGFKCPVVRFNAGKSYGVGYIDSPTKGRDGEGLGVTGVSQDEWGNVWCSGG